MCLRVGCDAILISCNNAADENSSEVVIDAIMLWLKFMEQLSAIILVEWKFHSDWLGAEWVITDPQYWTKWQLRQIIRTIDEKRMKRLRRSTTCALKRLCGRSGLLWIIEMRSKWPDLLIFILRTDAPDYDLIMQMCARRESFCTFVILLQCFSNSISLEIKSQ